VSAYVVGLVEIANPDGYREYMRHTPRLINQFGGRFIVRGGESEMLEGDAMPRVVVIEFPSLDQARTFYHSPEYARARKLREGAGIVRLLAIDGYSTAQWEAAVGESNGLSLE